MAKQVFVRNLPFSATEEDLRSTFAEAGTITEVKVLTDRETGRAKGSAIITFEEDEAAQTAIGFSGRDMGGRDMIVEAARERSERAPVAPNKKLFVGKLAYGVTPELLEQTFAEAGPVERVHVATDENGQSRGFGFVTMGTVEAAQAAVDMFDGKREVMGWTLAVRFAEDKPRDQRGGGNDRRGGGFSHDRGGFGGGHRGGFGGGNRGGYDNNRGGNRGGGRRDSNYGNDNDFGGGYDQF